MRATDREREVGHVAKDERARKEGTDGQDRSDVRVPLSSREKISKSGPGKDLERECVCVFTYRNDNVVETVEEGSELAEEPRTDGLEVKRINRRSVESSPKSSNCSPTVT